MSVAQEEFQRKRAPFVFLAINYPLRNKKGFVLSRNSIFATLMQHEIVRYSSLIRTMNSSSSSPFSPLLTLFIYFPSTSSQRTLPYQQRSKHSPHDRPSSKIDTSRIIPTLSLIQIREWPVGRGLANPICDFRNEHALSRGRCDRGDKYLPVQFCVGVAGI